MSEDRLVEVVDIASRAELQANEYHVAKARAANAPQQVQNPDGTWPHPECVDCDEEIPEGRLLLGRIRCVDCQSLLEKSGVK